MMPEISLNILDVTMNSVTAGASLIELRLLADSKADTLTLVIADNGCGMTPEQVENVTDPFFTSRTTRKVGLGIPFLKMAAEMAHGSFQIESQVGVGTTITAIFRLTDLNRMPIGDMAGTMSSLIGPNPDRDFVLTMGFDEKTFVMDTREFRSILGDISLGEPQVLEFIENYIKEHMEETGMNI